MDLENKSNDLLINIIIAYRKLGFEPESAKQAMIELAKRRQNNSSFEYEKIIEEKLKKL